MNSIDEYIAQFDPVIAERLQGIRNAIRLAAPDAEEKISYGMPTFTLYGNLVHFAAMKHHIGFYPGASGVEAFADKLKDFDTSKGTIRIPFDRPLPLELIGEIVLFRVNQNREAAWAKREKRKANVSVKCHHPRKDRIGREIRPLSEGPLEFPFVHQGF